MFRLFLPTIIRELCSLTKVIPVIYVYDVNGMMAACRLLYTMVLDVVLPIFPVSFVGCKHLNYQRDIKLKWCKYRPLASNTIHSLSKFFKFMVPLAPVYFFLVRYLAKRFSFVMFKHIFLPWKPFFLFTIYTANFPLLSCDAAVVVG